MWRVTPHGDAPARWGVPNLSAAGAPTTVPGRSIVMSTVATLLPQRTQLQRLRIALGDRHRLIECDDWQTLTRTCQTEIVHVVVIDLYADGERSFDRLRVLRERFPQVALVAYVVLVPERARDLFDAGRFGVDALALADQNDDPHTLLELVQQASSRGVGAAVRQMLPPMRATVRDAILLAVTRASEVLTPLALARILGISRRALALHLAAEGFPPPRRLLTWGRLIVAAHVMEDEHRSADSVALMLDFPSGSAFRNTCQRYVRATPGEIRASGGFIFVLTSFLAQRRAPARRRTPPHSATHIAAD